VRTHARVANVRVTATLAREMDSKPSLDAASEIAERSTEEVAPFPILRQLG
jgi:hypothetical protein